MAVVGGRVDKSKSTCLTPGGTLLTQRSSFSNIFNTGMVKLVEKRDKFLSNGVQNQIIVRMQNVCQRHKMCRDILNKQ